MNDPSPDDITAWSAARTLTDMGVLVADWLEGRRTWLPTYYGTGPDPETGPHIVTALARVNRAGWVTNSSQPGVVRSDLRQRAFVEGLIDRWVGLYAEHLSIGTDLVTVHIDRAGRADDAEDMASIPVTARGEQAQTWLGRWEPVGHETLLAAPLSPEAAAAVGTADVLQVLDPVWGRDDVLWPWLHRLAEHLTDGTAVRWLQSVLREDDAESAG